jgi:serine-type D-Ala-D-Ala carboxypeptidase (penicillin-binding protein 5/6)
MKKKRFLSLLLSLVMVLSLCLSNASAMNSEILSSMDVQAKAAMLIDMDTDYVLYEKNADEQSYPASITKMMTAYLVLKAVDEGKLSLDQVITAGDTAWQGLDSSSSNQNIKVGEQMTVENLLYCLMVASANEAANILAVAVSGSIEAFVEEMNSAATELGCTGTHFVNPHGMPDANHYTTARDLCKIAKAAMSNSTFRKIVSTQEYYIEPTNMTETRRHFFNTNGLLSNKKYQGYYYEYCIGIKTGSTDAAGYCLISAAEKDGQTLICVVLGCENPTDESGTVQHLQFSESKRLFEWGFKNFTKRTILDTSTPIAEVPVTLSTENDYVTVQPAESISSQLPNDVNISDFQWITDLPDSVEAPVEAGQVLGTVTVTLDGDSYGTVDLVAVSSVSRSSFLATKHSINLFLHSWQFMLIVTLIALGIIALIVLRIVTIHRRNTYTGRRRYHGKKRK